MRNHRTAVRLLSLAIAATTTVLAPAAVEAAPDDDIPTDRTRLPIGIDTGFPHVERITECEAKASDWPVVGRSRRVDMGGIGARPDELSIRGHRGAYMLHLERFGGQDSSLLLSTRGGHVPSIEGLVDIDDKHHVEPTEPHPYPWGDEVFVHVGSDFATGWAGLFGTDEHGCLAAYTIDGDAGPEPYEIMFRDQTWFRSGWHCPYGLPLAFDAARQTNGGWLLTRNYLHRTHPTGVGVHSFSTWNAPSTADLPEIGDEC